MVHRFCADTVVNTVEIVKRNSLQLSLGSAGEYASLFEKDYFDASKSTRPISKNPSRNDRKDCFVIQPLESKVSPKKATLACFRFCR